MFGERFSSSGKGFSILIDFEVIILRTLGLIGVLLLVSVTAAAVDAGAGGVAKEELLLCVVEVVNPVLISPPGPITIFKSSKCCLGRYKEAREPIDE